MSPNLREIGEITAVAALQDSQMTEQEALPSFAAIADWVDENGSRDGAACGRIIRRLHQTIGGVDFDRLDDRAAITLFDAGGATLEASRS